MEIFFKTRRRNWSFFILILCRKKLLKNSKTLPWKSVLPCCAQNLPTPRIGGDIDVSKQCEKSSSNNFRDAISARKITSRQFWRAHEVATVIVYPSKSDSILVDFYRKSYILCKNQISISQLWYVPRCTIMEMRCWEYFIRLYNVETTYVKIWFFLKIVFSSPKSRINIFILKLFFIFWINLSLLHLFVILRVDINLYLWETLKSNSQDRKLCINDVLTFCSDFKIEDQYIS